MYRFPGEAVTGYLLPILKEGEGGSSIFHILPHSHDP